jgi:hypothetical protein
MSLLNYAKQKALNIAESAFNQSNPELNTNPGSAIRSLVLVPFSLTFAVVIQEIDRLKNLYISNYNQLSDSDMDILAANLLKKRPTGTQSTTNVRVYLKNPVAFTVDSFPYFQTVDGRQFSPIRKTIYKIEDIISDNGEWYVNIPVISTTFGANSAASSGEITKVKNFPVSVSRVNNVRDTTGGSSSLTNEGFFNYIKKTISDGTLVQSSGLNEFIVSKYQNVSELKIVTPGDALMVRDEIWQDEDGNPNLDRNGSPWATHDDIGVINFDYNFGRAYSATGAFTSEHLGKRIQLVSDVEKYRTITNVIDANYAIISGESLYGDYNAYVWGEGPHMLLKSDAYVYLPSVEIQSKVVNKSNPITITKSSNYSSEGSDYTRIWYEVAGGDLSLLAPISSAVSVKIVAGEGLEGEVTINALEYGLDAFGSYINCSYVPATSVPANTTANVYNTESIMVGTDIVNTPVLYVLQVETIDPISLETIEVIPRSEPGKFSSPGWYITNTDQSNLFSSKEEKTIFIDTKEQYDEFRLLSFSSGQIADSGSYQIGRDTAYSGNNRITASYDWSGTKGREILISLPEMMLDGYGYHTPTVSTNGGDYLLLSESFYYKTSIGYRDDFFVSTKNGSGIITQVYSPGEVMVYGNRMELKVGSFPAGADSSSVVMFFPDIGDDAGNTFRWLSDGRLYDGANIYVVDSDEPKIDSVQLEAVILDTDESTYIDVVSEVDLHGISKIITDPPFDPTVLLTIEAGATYGDYLRYPVRVVYASHSDISTIQSDVDGSDQSLLCEDTLIRSFYPCLIDSSITFKGNSSANQVFNRFVNLIQDAATEVDSNSRVRIDISNIIAALDEEGLVDFTDVNPEIRVTTFIADGGLQTRYINPSRETKQVLVTNAAVSMGDASIVLKRYKDMATISGRGKLFLGGTNPNIQEIIPYEAVVEQDDGTFIFIFRDGFTLAYSHPQWESVVVSKRDYDPELEFLDGAIYIEPNSRPYIRQLSVKKLNQ